MIDTLKFPTGEFTHTELAQANGKTNQQVWTAYQAAIKAGTIVSAGLRPNPSGKGKPSKIWKVADGVPVPLVDKVEVVKVEAPKPEPTLVVVTETAVVVEPLPVVVPTTAPVEAETVEVVEVIAPPVVRNLTCQVVEIDEVCPFCSTKLLSVETSGGIKVWCPVNDLKICSCSENPYGVSNNVKNAVEILHDKFFKHRSPVKA